MKKMKQYKGWGIYQNNAKEVEEYGFEITVLHPDYMYCNGFCSPIHTDIEINTVEEAISWINNY